MVSELVVAIRDRLLAGQTKEDIKAAVLAMGHTDVVFESAYTLAEHDMGQGSIPSALPADTVWPTAASLFTAGLSFMMKRLDLVALLAVPMVLSIILDEVSAKLTGHLWGPSVIDAINMLVLICYVFFLGTVLHVVAATSKGEESSLRTGLNWSWKNIGGLLFVYIMTFLAVWGGLLLLIVPAFIVFVCTYFTQYVFVHEQKGGMKALLRSRELVHGRFFKVFWTLLGFLFLSIMPVIVITIISQSLVVDPLVLVLSILTEVILAFVAVLNIFAINILYRHLASDRPALQKQPLFLSARYWLLIASGVVMSVLVIIVAVFIDDTDSLYKHFPTVLESQSLKSEVSHTALLAREYALAHNGSYQGVCDILVPTLTSADSKECNQSETQWAVAGVLGDERFCADTTTLMKEIKTPLEGRLSCIDVPKNIGNTEIPPEPTSTSTEASSTVENL